MHLENCFNGPVETSPRRLKVCVVSDKKVVSHLGQNDKCHSGFRLGIFDPEIPPKEVHTEEYEDSDEGNDYHCELPDLE